jgi:8-oxo-dGTP pyrophosphatase MutT (NUDIX family)
MKEGQYHLVVNIFLVNSQKELLIQKRSNTVEWKPDIWAATGGSAVTGEDPYEACIRELKEEIGIDVVREDLKMLAIYQRKFSYQAVFLMHSEATLSQMTMQEEEVAELKWATIAEIKDMIKKHIFHKYQYFDWLCEIIEGKQEY